MNKQRIKIISVTKTFSGYIYTTTIASIFYVLVFILLFFLSENQPITFSTLIKIHIKYPYLLLVEILPILIFFMSNLIISDISRKVYSIENELALLNSKNRAIYNFIEKLRQGDTNVSFPAEFMQDRLIQALIKLRDELKRSREEEEQRKKEDQQRHWINEGLAKFSAILREYVEDLQKLAEEITSNLTRYLDAKQAAFFIIKEEGNEKYLEMIAFFAYDRKKFPDKKLLWGEGLIGAAAIEKKTIVLNEVTENFVEITSGLGSANPRAIIISPLVDDEDNVHGVIEMASFSPFEDYQVSFIEQVSRSIADTIANIKRNLRTQELLKASQQQAEILAQQEEQMRRSMEELKMLQQEAAKQSEEFISFTNSVNKALLRAEFTKDGFLVFANENFLKTLGYNDYFEIINKHVTEFLAESDRELFDTFWNKFIEQDQVYDADIRFISKDGIFERWIAAAFIGIKDKQGNTLKVLLLGLDRTQQRLKQIEYENELNQINKFLAKIEFSTDGKVLDANSTFLTLTGFKTEDILNKPYQEVLNITDIEDFEVIWRNILTGHSHSTIHKITTSSGSTIWLEGFYSAIMINNVPQKVIFYAIDITTQKDLELKLKQTQEKLQKTIEEIKTKQQEFEQEKQQLIKQKENIEISNKLFINTFENLDQAVVAIDETEHIIIFNPLAEELWNIKREVVLGKRLSSILPEIPHTYEDDVEYLLTYFNTKEPLVNASRLSYIIDKTGKRINIKVYIVKAEYKGHFILTAFIKNMEL